MLIMKDRRFGPSHVVERLILRLPFLVMKPSTKTIIKNFLLGLFLALIARKVYIGNVAMSYVSKCKHQVTFEAMVKI